MTALLALLLAAAPDAGVPVVVARDGGVALAPADTKKATSGGSEVEKLKKDVAELRSKVSDLESKHAEEVGKLNKRLEKMQSWMDAEDERRETEVRDAERRRANAAEVQNTLNVALTQLSTGNVNNLEKWLRSAEGIATPDAAKWIAVARQAISQNDLVSARQALVLAISSTQ
ncbi:MAG: hypothetical protein DI536_31210 [Archangium gephyra]|uniref:Uncharacterized protein n=1 Tax=Archangium gephyra TaxID=48 RepID=A0A2W5SSX2_9BACT|nr:MAG: hypothetical protein DI536_31210 [Archangium gephyra]